MRLVPKVSPTDDDLSFIDSRSDLILSKPYLKRIYVEWSEIILGNLVPSGVTVELGAANPVTRRVFAQVNALGLDILPNPALAVRADATLMPFASNSVANLVATDTFHHLPDAELFLAEVSRVLIDGGKLVLIEPWSNCLADFIYGRFHPEPFKKDSAWITFGAGPMTRANGALPWIVFERDRLLFAERFPALAVTAIRQLMPVSYLVSGGARTRIGMPGMLYKVIRKVERFFERRGLGLSALIVVTKNNENQMRDFPTAPHRSTDSRLLL